MRTAYSAVVILCLCAVLLATDAGPNSGTGSGASWTTPTNTATINATYATCTLAVGPDTICGSDLVISSLGFSIPTGATITGITLTEVRKCSLASHCNTQDSLANNLLCLQKTTTCVGTKKGTGTTWTNVDTTDTWGSSSDLWGTTWSVSEVNASTFGARTNVNNANGGTGAVASIDYLAITVSYTVGGKKGQVIVASQTRSGQIHPGN